MLAPGHRVGFDADQTEQPIDSRADLILQQFRIIEKHLILLDEDADIIVDYALNIIK